MKKFFMVNLCILLVFLTGCGNRTVEYEPETSSEEVHFEHLITYGDLKQLYKDNKEVFNDVIIEINKLPEYVYAISFDNKEVIISNGTGKIITEKFDCDYDRFIECFEILYGFADEKLGKEYKISITKNEYDISFNIRSFDVMVDYDIKYVENNKEAESYINIEGPWYLFVWGLV